MLLIKSNQIKNILTMEKCITLMAEALIKISSGEARQIIRVAIPIDGKNLLGIMPSVIPFAGIAGTKILSIFPENYKRNIPSHQGKILLFEIETGKLKAIVDAESITGIRTAAASAAVTDALANPGASKLAILGAGIQGRQHMHGISLIRKIDEVCVWDIYPEAAKRFSKQMSEKLGIPVKVCATAKEATQNADIICTVTPSKEPIIDLRDVKEGVHINAVGACHANAREVGGNLIAASRLFVDKMDAALVEAGDILLAVRDGAITKNHIIGEAGMVLSGQLPGRVDRKNITIFESLGQATEDLMAANYVANEIFKSNGRSW